MKDISAKVHAVFVHVTNLEKSAKWYSELMGVPFKDKDVRSPIYTLPLNGETYLTLDDHKNDPNFVFSPFLHPAFNLFSTDLHNSYRDIKDAGIKIVREIETHGNFGWFHIADPDDNVVMVCGDIL